MTAISESYRGKLSAGALLLMTFLICLAFAHAPNGNAQTRLVLGAATNTKPAGPHQVIVGAYLENIQGLDLSTNSFQADLYVWMRWRDPALAPYESIEVMNPYESWALTTKPVTPKPVKQPDGSWYYAIRYQGGFNTRFDLAKFPFGEQLLQIQFEDQFAEANELTYVVDQNPIALDPQVTIPGYNIGTPTIAAQTVHYATNFGDLRTIRNDSYSRFTISIPVSHPFWATFVKVLLPILLVVATASLIFHVPPRLIEARIGLGITALLTLVAMQWSALSSLPDGGYLVMLDLIYIASFAFVLISLIQSLVASWKAREGIESVAIALDKRSMYIDLVVYIALVALILWAYLH